MEVQIRGAKILIGRLRFSRISINATIISCAADYLPRFEPRAKLRVSGSVFYFQFLDHVPGGNQRFWKSARQPLAQFSPSGASAYSFDELKPAPS
jgi:hypothetical protein